MAKSKNRSQLHLFIAIPVVLIILGAFVLSAGAVVENLRFVRAASQILGLVDFVRSFAGQQRTVVFNSGDDIWADIARLGQTPPPRARTNPWDGSIRTIAIANMAMRIESDLPSQDCRRLALYFLERQPAELGLLSEEAQSDQETSWAAIYPPPASGADFAAETACGKTHFSRLALVFRIR